MITKAKNKDMATTDTVVNKAVEQEYHFAGSTEFLPATVTAPSKEEAEKIYLKTRIIKNNN